MELTAYQPATTPAVHLNGHTPAAEGSAGVHIKQPQPATSPRTVRRRLPNLHDQAVLGGLFYASVLTIALAGGAQAAQGWLGWWMPFNVAVVAVVELGGVYLSVMADHRRQLGEQAIAARVGSAFVAVGATALNLVGHANQPIQAGVFATASAGGYAVWLIRSGQRRRDQLRAAGKMSQPPPVYGLIQWMMHPIITPLARSLAKANPSLGRAGSLTTAEQDIKAGRRRKAMLKLVKADLRKTLGPDNADLLVTVLDPDRLTAAIEEQADLSGMAAIYARRIDPAKIEAAVAQSRRRSRERDRALVAAATPAAPAGEAPAEPRPTGRARRVGVILSANRLTKEETLAQFDKHMLEPGMTKTEAAKRVGVSPAYIWKLRRNQPASQESAS